MSVKKQADKVVDAVKRNPQIALGLIGLLFPKLIAKIGPVVIGAIAATAAKNDLPK